MKELKLTNRKFGILRVLQKSQHQKKGSGIFWDCICDCGNQRIVMAAQLQNKSTRSCGCRQTKDFTGQHFGELTVIKRIAQKGERTKYLSQCSCGNQITCDGSKLKNRINCGCKKNKVKPRLPIVDVVCNNLFTSYKANAKNKKLPFRISKKKFCTMIFNKCYYCGDNPKTLFRKWRADEGCRFNGVDRKDNTLGYTQSNCVSCCSQCNYKKNAQHINGFVQWIRKVANNLRDYKTPEKWDLQSEELYTKIRKIPIR